MAYRWWDCVARTVARVEYAPVSTLVSKCHTERKDRVRRIEKFHASETRQIF